jgi:hypothetical protein
MIPVRKFTNDLVKKLKRNKKAANIQAQIMHLRKNGYIEFNLKVPDFKDYRQYYIFRQKYIDWCYKNYYDDFVVFHDSIYFFTNENTAILMKLSVE